MFKIVHKQTSIEVKDTEDYFIDVNGGVFKIADDYTGLDLIQQFHLEVKIK